MSEKYFPKVLAALEEYQNNMAMIDTLNKLEKLELIPSADEWREFRKLGNPLVHEYPDNEDEILEGIKLSLSVFIKVKDIYMAIIDQLKAKGLLESTI
ncbi:MAG: hypothetical protein IEMM0008_0671 [bacterium]|nr:MAG: hypothetical protein IEMM0008_0671 [bacterium]